MFQIFYNSYLTDALITVSGNHSCDPNAEISFVHGDHTMTLMALKDIMPEEVNIYLHIKKDTSGLGYDNIIGALT